MNQAALRLLNLGAKGDSEDPASLARRGMRSRGIDEQVGSANEPRSHS